MTGAQVTVLLVLALPVLINGAKILLLTTPFYSHCLEVSSVGEALVARGHEVKVFLGSKFKHKNCFKKGGNATKEITPIIYRIPEELQSVEERNSELTESVKENEYNIFSSTKIVTLSRLLCQHALSDRDAIIALKEEHFDLAIVDCFFVSYCHYAIPHVLDIPFVSVGTHIDDFLSGSPILPSIVPLPMTRYTDNMSFLERLSNAAMYIFIHMFSRQVMNTDIISDYIPGVTAQYMVNYVSKSELFIYNYDPVLAYPVPTMPNHVLAGGLCTSPAKPLGGELKQIYSQSGNGIIVVSFGSSFGSLPEKTDNKLIGVLNRLKMTTVWKDPKRGRDGDVIKLSWLPQNDLLGDPRTKLFISHCGNNGVYEALYHGVPIVCTPLFGDQFANALRVEHIGAGRYVNLITSTEEELFEVVSDVLNNHTYRGNMKKASAIFHSRPFIPKQRAAFWVEHVLKFGGEHLRSRSTEMHLFQFLGYDLLSFVFFMTILSFLLFFKCFAFCLKQCCKVKQSTKAKIN